MSESNEEKKMAQRYFFNLIYFMIPSDPNPPHPGFHQDKYSDKISGQLSNGCDLYSAHKVFLEFDLVI